jgi:ABC-2 type transport system permease protein
VSVATEVAGPTAAGVPEGIGVSLARILGSEWLKFRTLRSSWITLAVAVGGMIGISALVCWATDNRWSHMGPVEQATFDPMLHSIVGVTLAQLAVGVLGVLFVTGEYGTGMIKATLGAVPKRTPVLVAKVVVFVGVILAAAIPGVFAAFFLGQALLGSHSTTIGAHDVLRCVLGAGLYLGAVGALSVGFGFLVRNTAGGIAALFGLLLVIDGIAHALPESWQHYIVPYLPAEAGSSVFSLTREFDQLSAWTGFAVLCAWAAAALLLGWWSLLRKDA